MISYRVGKIIKIVLSLRAESKSKYARQSGISGKT